MAAILSRGRWVNAMFYNGMLCINSKATTHNVLYTNGNTRGFIDIFSVLVLIIAISVFTWLSSHTLQGCFTGTGTIVWVLAECQRNSLMMTLFAMLALYDGNPYGFHNVFLNKVIRNVWCFLVFSLLKTIEHTMWFLVIETHWLMSL